jgi:hypothetical protein
MVRLRGFETLDFDEAVTTERERLAAYAPDDISYKRYAYVDRGRYGYQFERALNLFPHEQKASSKERRAYYPVERPFLMFRSMELAKFLNHLFVFV